MDIQKQLDLLDRNAEIFMALQARATLFCIVPDCGFPLNAEEHHFLVFGEKRGPVCHVCHDMYWAVQVRKYFVDIHADWEKDQRIRKNILDSENYFR